jgi:hypothetical protein
MATWNPFRKETPNTRHTYGYSFEWTDGHWTEEQLKPLRYSYDVLAEKALDQLDIISPPPNNALPRNRDRTSTAELKETDVSEKREPDFKAKRDLYVILKENHDKHPDLQAIWDQVNTVPDWVDWDQIKRGQEVFYRYAGPALTALTFQSLLGGMGANRIVEVLARTGGFNTKVARHRLLETTQHILQATKSLESIQPGGEGFASTIRVRLLHTAVRRRIMKLAKERPQYYNVEELGVPINDLDSIGTIGSFSATLIWLGFPRQGIFLRDQEITDYLACWRYIAYLIGCPDEHFSSPEKAKGIMDSILYYEVNPSQVSKNLANNIIVALQGQAPTYASPDFLYASARWLNGNDLGDDLGLKRPSLYYWALVLAQNLFFMALCYTYRSIDWLDKRNIARFRRITYKIVLDPKDGLGKETVFDFKYLPNLSLTGTPAGEMDMGLKARGAEMRNFATLCVAGLFLGIAGYVGLSASRALTARFI